MEQHARRMDSIEFTVKAERKAQQAKLAWRAWRIRMEMQLKRAANRLPGALPPNVVRLEDYKR